MKLQSKITLVLVVLVVFLSFLFFNEESSPVAKVNGIEIDLELALTPAQQIQGLSNRSSLGDNTGMLFVFNDYKKRSFWMKEMQFPIDILWIKDNKIMQIEKNAPTHGENGIPTFDSPPEINYVLELNAGFSDTHGINAGDVIEFNL